MLNEIFSEKTACKNCVPIDSCLPKQLDIAHQEALVKQQFQLMPGEKLCLAGDEFHFLYAVQTGAFKSVTSSTDGREQIRCFYFHSEIIGFGALEGRHHTSTIIALTKSIVCAISFKELLCMAQQVPELQEHLLSLMSKRLLANLSIPRNSAAGERFIYFLLNVSDRCQPIKANDLKFHLPMSRQDIGNYLGLALETVSRLFSQLKADKLIDVHGKDITFYDVERLRSLVAC